ncbi:MAG TPA: hypothetical protein VFO62_10785 [Candidatus Binatia bacterium]|nr:hypothetical protein [Candidatus Binatia bacterium]
MRLRIARKMDPRRARDIIGPRPWFGIYTDEQLQRAERRLRRSHHTRCPVIDGWRAVHPDFFAANRVHARHIQQRALRRVRKGWR